MAEDAIGSIKGVGKKKKVQELSHLKRGEAFKAAPKVGEVKGDSIQFSDEVGQLEADNSVNFDTLKDSIANLKEQVAAKPSGHDASSGLVNDALAVQMEKNGLQAAKSTPHLLGLSPGVKEAGVYSTRGIQGGLKKGMQAGGSFSSRRSSNQVYQPGGGTATPNMVKLQTNYADAIKKGHQVSPESNRMVIETFANAGKTEKPLRSMLGL